MRILACGDLHVDPSFGIPGHAPVDATGEPLTLAQARRTLAWIGDVARDHRVDLILCGGDVFDRPRPGAAAEDVVFRAFSRWAQVAPVVVLTGNHDLAGTGVHALEPMKSLRPGRIHVIDRPGRVMLPSDLALDIYALPYPTKAYISAGTASPEETNVQVSRALADVLLAMALDARGQASHGRPAVLLAHGTLAGASYNDSQTAAGWDVQIPTDHLGAFDLAVFSHLHMRQAAPGYPSIGPNHTHGYVGAPDRFTFGEADEPKGVSVLYTEGGGGDCVFVENPHVRQFITLDPEETVTGENVLDRMAVDDLAGETRPIYRVVGETDHALYDAVATSVRRLKAAGVLIGNQCTVARPDRQRVETRADLGMESVVAAACASRPDLAEHTDDIIARVRGLGVGR